MKDKVGKLFLGFTSSYLQECVVVQVIQLNILLYKGFRTHKRVDMSRENSIVVFHCVREGIFFKMAKTFNPVLSRHQTEAVQV